MNIRFNLSSKQDSTGNAELYMRIVIDRGHVYRVKSGIYIPARSWNEKTEKIIVPRLRTELQTSLIQLQIKIDNLVHCLTEHIYSIPTDSLSKAIIESIIKEYNEKYIGIPQEADEDDPFKKCFDSFIKLQVKTKKRAEQYVGLWKQMTRFVVYMKGTFIWKFDIQTESILAFEHFLLEEHTFVDENGKPLKQYEYIYSEGGVPKRINRGKNAVAGIIKRLRIFFNWAQKAQMFTCQSPFVNYNAHQCVYGTPYFMTKQELDIVYAKDFSSNKQLEFHRDLFIFQSNVGMRVGDLFALTSQNIVDGETLEYIPSKTLSRTCKNVSVPLTKVAKSILDKYHDDTRVELFPFINTNYYNEDIKVILRTAGITRKITIYDPLTSTTVQREICDVAASHMARRNFIGNLYNKVADPNIIGSMTGHVEGSKAFARYRTIGEDLKKNALSALE